MSWICTALTLFYASVQKDVVHHGIDWDGPLPDTEDVGVPAIPVPLEHEDVEELLHTVCPTEPSV